MVFGNLEYGKETPSFSLNITDSQFPSSIFFLCFIAPALCGNFSLFLGKNKSLFWPLQGADGLVKSELS